jgi:D-threo-aldose 1-dehydrogenase
VNLVQGIRYINLTAALFRYCMNKKPDDFNKNSLVKPLQKQSLDLQYAVTDLQLPKIIWGTSSLGNLYYDTPYEEKLTVIEAVIKNNPSPVVFDTAGKYGAGLALEVLGQCLHDLNVASDNIIISNKLGWLRTELKTEAPTFESGVWKNIKHDAIQQISYQGILQCFEEGNQLLKNYTAQLVSVHDPDEYLDAAKNEQEREKRYEDIFNAYTALSELKAKKLVRAIGVGSKNWKVTERIAQHVPLDWVMIANSMTIHSHPEELITFINSLNSKGIAIINAAVFNGGFLAGSDFYNYKFVKPDTAANKALFKWRADFYSVCNEFDVSPAAACVYFGLHIPGVKSIALNSSSAKQVKENMLLADAVIPSGFWDALKLKKLINPDYPFL